MTHPPVLTDDQLLAGLRNTNLPAGSFHHRDHLRAGWLYLERWTLSEALTRFSTDLQGFATAQGAPEKFHTTITWALLFALDTRRRALGPAHSWGELAESSPELLDWKAFLRRYYTDQLLWSETARLTFVLPDRLALADLPDGADEASSSTPDRTEASTD